jgi:hypothetical protein
MHANEWFKCFDGLVIELFSCCQKMNIFEVLSLNTSCFLFSDFSRYRRFLSLCEVGKNPLQVDFNES